MRRLIAIGDIHGHRLKLETLLDTIQPTSDDQLVFLGDYVDRGPDSRGVIDKLLSFQEEFPHTVFLRGNHEQLLLDALIEKGIRTGPTLRDLSAWYRQTAKGTDVQLFIANGGDKTMDSYRWEWNLPSGHIAFLEGSMPWWRYAEFLFVHAGCLNVEPEELDPWVLLWSRFCGPGTDGEIQVVGHTPLENEYPKLEQGKYWLDTGCAYDGPLSACDVLTMEIWQAR